MAVKKGAVVFKDTELRVSLKEGDIVPCPKCPNRHIVQRDQRPGRRFNTETGVTDTIRNEALYVECPDAPGPILVGIEGKVLPTPLELTPRR